MDLEVGYPTPHCHPQSLDSGSTPESFIARELELQTGTITVTDHGSMGVCRKIYDLAKPKGLTPILGVEAYFRDDSCPILLAKGVDPAKHLKYYHLTLHALDQEAYYALVKEISTCRQERHGHEAKPLLDWAALARLGQHNITVGSGCLVGMVQRHLLAYGDVETAKAYYKKVKALFKPGNFIVEVFPHRCTHDWVEGVFLTMEDGTVMKLTDTKKLTMERDGNKSAADIALMAKHPAWKPDRLVSYLHYRKPVIVDKIVIKVERVEGFVENECLPWTSSSDVQHACNEVLLGFAKEMGDPVVVSDDSHYASPDDKIVQDIRLGQFGSWRFFGNYARQSVGDSWEYFNSYGFAQKDFEGWIENNREWASRFKAFELVEPVTLPTKFYPQNTLDHLIHLIRQQGRMQWGDEVYRSRLNAEIKLLYKNGTIDLLPYFFLGADVVAAHADQGVLTGPGRGSAAGLLIAYLLGITHVDPLVFGLSMDRFLTLDRVKSGKMPDIDQDLPHRDLLCETHDEEWIDLSFDDGSKRRMRPNAIVKVADGSEMTLEIALEKGMSVEWA